MGSLDKLYKSKGITIGANVIVNGICCTIKKIAGLDIQIECGKTMGSGYHGVGWLDVD